MSFTDFDKFYIGSLVRFKFLHSLNESVGSTGYDVVYCDFDVIDEKTLNVKKDKSYKMLIRLKEHYMEITKAGSDRTVFEFHDWNLDIRNQREFKEMGLSENNLKEIYTRAKNYSKHKHEWMMGFDTPCKLRTFIEDFGETDYVSISNSLICDSEDFNDYFCTFKFLHKNKDKYDEIIFSIDKITESDGEKSMRVFVIPPGAQSACIFFPHYDYIELLHAAIHDLIGHYSTPYLSMKETTPYVINPAASEKGKAA